MEGQRPQRLYDRKNDTVRIDSVEQLDDHFAVSLMSFFRQLDAPHLYFERVRPILDSGDSTIYAAVRERPWPPWGLGARRVGALVQTHPVGTGSYGLSPIYTADEDATNIGLMAAVYSEALEGLRRGGKAEVNYLVLEGSVFADHILRRVGFKRSDDLVATDDEVRYAFYRADAGEVAAALGFDRISVPELLAHEIDEKSFDRLALYVSGLALASQPNRWVDRLIREIIAIDIGLFDASLPGGTPPTPSPPTALPGFFPGEIDPGPEELG